MLRLAGALSLFVEPPIVSGEFKLVAAGQTRTHSALLPNLVFNSNRIQSGIELSSWIVAIELKLSLSPSRSALWAIFYINKLHGGGGAGSNQHHCQSNHHQRQLTAVINYCVAGRRVANFSPLGKDFEVSSWI